MRRRVWIAAVLCAALAFSMSLQAAEPIAPAASQPGRFVDAPVFYSLSGEATQGGLMVGRAPPASEVTLDGKPVAVNRDGLFILGFSRDHPLTAELVVAIHRGPRERRQLLVMPRIFQVQRIEGLPERYVSPPPEDLARIEEERRLIREARRRASEASHVAGGFIWPLTGTMSGVYGSQRVLNGQPRAPHLGVDIAAPRGAAVKAPADGTVALAAKDLFFNGHVIMLDHGLGLTTIYAHLDEFEVKQGETVKQGQVIAKVGASGRATGPHLHWGAHWFDIGLDPQLIAGAMPNTAP